MIPSPNPALNLRLLNSVLALTQPWLLPTELSQKIFSSFPWHRDLEFPNICNGDGGGGGEIPGSESFLGSRVIFMEQAKRQEAFGSCQTCQFWHLPVATLGNTASLVVSIWILDLEIVSSWKLSKILWHFHWNSCPQPPYDLSLVSFGCIYWRIPFFLF